MVPKTKDHRSLLLLTVGQLDRVTACAESIVDRGKLHREDKYTEANWIALDRTR